VAPGDLVVGGTVSIGGRLVVRATKVGLDTQLAHMVRLVEDAQNQKAAVQRLADRISSVFVPAVIAIALITLAAWLSAGASSERAFSACLSVLIIACPCALGLATPTALLVATGRGAQLGIFFKGYEGLEASRQVDTVVLDKTGTVTEGQMSVTDVEIAPGLDRDEVLRWAGALEQASEHLVARAIAAAAQQELGALPHVDRFVALPGLGARGSVEGHEISVGRSELFAPTPLPGNLAARGAAWEALGRTTVLVGCDDRIVGAVAVADTIRPSAGPAVRQLQALGLRCILLTGDNATTARAVGDSIGVSEIVAGALPADKVALIRRLQQTGRSVAMVGDGVNDGPALASADLGLAVGSGTDVAINAADLIIMRDDLRVVATAIGLARRTLSTIRGNLAWAFAYNVAAIPLAACGLLNPLIAAGAMALSSGFVVWNSSRLAHFERRAAPELPNAARSEHHDEHVPHGDAHADVAGHLEPRGHPTRLRGARERSPGAGQGARTALSPLTLTVAPGARPERGGDSEAPV
jgi:heavy metal translocating P-type ATPase